MATEFYKCYSYGCWLFPVGVETSCAASQSLALLSLVIGLMLVLQSWSSRRAHSVAVYNTKSSQPILLMAKSTLYYDSVLNMLWNIWSSDFIKRLEMDSYYTLDKGLGSTVIVLFSNSHVILSMQTEKQEVERPREKTDWACWLARVTVILQVH